MKKSPVLFLAVFSLCVLSACSGSGGSTVQSPATHFSVTAPANATAGTTFNFTVTALDASNNVVATYSGTVHFTSTDGQAALPGNSMLVNGTGSFSATLGTAGGQTITATGSVNASITGTSNSTSVSGGAASRFSVTVPGAATAGIAFSFTVTALDKFNNTAASYSGTVHFTSSDEQAVLPADSPLTNAVGNFSGTLKTVGSETITGTDTVTVSITGTSNAISVTGPATHFSVTALASANTLQAFNFTVTARDAANNVATGYSGTVHFTSTDAQAVLPANSTLTSGMGTFSATLKTNGSQTITATDTVTATITGTSNSIQVTVSLFNSAGSMETPGAAHTATLLSNGKVLIAGGFGETGVLDTAELFDPTSTSFSPTGSMTVPRCYHTATLLGDGKVLITGGSNGAENLDTAELFDPSTGIFTPTGSMETARISQTATLLSNGKVLIAGGFGETGVLDTAELFDPSTGMFTPTGSMETTRYLQTATLLNNGEVLIAGGFGETAALDTAELFDPSTGMFTPTGSMETARASHTATLLSNGEVLIAGGFEGTEYFVTAELFHPSTGIFTPTGSMESARRDHTASLLNDGMVLVTGGEYLTFGPLRGCYPQLHSYASAELYDPTSGTFTYTSNMATPRALHRATLFTNGEVLVTGGEHWTYATLPSGCSTSTAIVTASAELFQ
jgi:hypothetical protein